MAGRGRGRGGKPNLSFEIGSLGFGAGEALPAQTLQPPPTYPPLQQRPTPLSSTEIDEYLLALSQEYRGSIKDSPFYLKPNTVKKDITRYTDRYKHTNQNSDTQKWEPDWRYFPEELKPTIKKKSLQRKVKVNLNAAKRKEVIAKEDVVKKLEELVQKEVGEGKTIENEDDKEEDVEGEEELEEEFEDDNDYNFDYYDDGGDNYADDDDREEGPVY